MSFRRAILRAGAAAAFLIAAQVQSGCGDRAGASADRTAAPPQAQEAPASASDAAVPGRGAMVEGAPPLVFEPAEMDLGLLAEGAAGTASVLIRNAGDLPVTIAGTRPSCACTYAQNLAGKVLAPGDAVELTATMTPKPGLGRKHEEIRVMAHGYNAYLTLSVNAEVSLPVRATPPALEAYTKDPRVPAPDQGTVVIQSLDGTPFRIRRADGKRPVFVDHDPDTDAPRSEYTLRWDLRPYTRQTIPWWWIVETDHPDAPLVDLRVQHEWTMNPRGARPRWIPGDPRIVGGVLHRGESFEFTTKLQYNPKMTALPQDTPIVQAATAGIHAKLLAHERVGTDIQCTIRVMVLAEGPGLLYEKFLISHGGYTAPPIMFFATLEG